jgi:hypothetical protein
MIAGSPPGRIAKLFTAWADWLFAKLSPPEPRREAKSEKNEKSEMHTQPPRLVKSDDQRSRVASPGRR